LQPQDLAQLAAFCRQDKVIALEIAEFDPGQDSGQQSLKQLRDFIAAVTQTDP
jgi:arginase family enzyme